MAGALKARLDATRAAACKVPVLGILVRAGLRAGEDNAKDMAASIAYFGMLSLFPLILGLLAVASSVLKSEAMRRKVLDWVNEFFPVGADFVTQNIESLVRLRGAAGFASIVVLFWSARKMVGAIGRGVNRALELDRTHAGVLSPLRDYGMVLAVSLLMFGTTALTPLADLVSDFEMAVLGKTWGRAVGVIGGYATSMALTGTMFGFTYLLIPYKRQHWRDIWPGILTAVVLIEAGKKLFVYWVDNVSSLDALYGAISSFIVLMLWLYFFGWVLVFGAEVNYVYRQDQEAGA